MAKKRRIRSIWRSFAKLMILLTALCVGGYYIKVYLIKSVSFKYTAFGIDISSNYLIHGIDVSKYQRVIDWEDLKAMSIKNINIRFVYIKATEGIDLLDEQFRRNWLEAEDYGMTKGAYHFFVAGESGKQQAKNFISIVELKKGDLPPVLDIEYANGANADEIQRF